MSRSVGIITAKHMSANRNQLTIIRGLHNSYFFDTYPANIENLPILTCWINSGESLNFDLKVISPTGNIVFLENCLIDAAPINAYCFNLTTIETTFDIPGIYDIQVHTKDGLQSSMPMEFAGPVFQPKPVKVHKPEISAFLMATKTVSIQPAEISGVIAMVETRYFKNNGPLSLIIGWKNLKRSFNAKASLLDPSGKSLGDTKFDVVCKQGDLISYCFLNMENIPIRTAGLYSFEIYYYDHQRTYPLRVLD